MENKKIFIGIVPCELRRLKNIVKIDISDLISHLPKPKGKIEDLTKNDHIIIYPSSKIWLTNYSKLKCKVSLMIAEPTVVHKKYYHLLWLLSFKFNTVFVRYQHLENRYKNIKVVPIVECWIPQLTAEDFLQKNKLLSIVASSRAQHIGHQLRHQIIKEIDMTNIAVLGRAYQPFKNKMDGLLPYQFSIIIENCQENDYFSEKLVDSFACLTVPIYWGCSNIGDYFDIKGMIIFNSIDELKIILQNLKTKDYQKFVASLEKNKQIAIKLANTSQLIADKLDI